MSRLGRNCLRCHCNRSYPASPDVNYRAIAAISTPASTVWKLANWKIDNLPHQYVLVCKPNVVSSGAITRTDRNLKLQDVKTFHFLAQYPRLFQIKGLNRLGALQVSE
jgi:hypothetical protein